jgi:hypothetical protein
MGSAAESGALKENGNWKMEIGKLKFEPRKVKLEKALNIKMSRLSRPEI